MDPSKEKNYEIGGRAFVQKPLVLGQVEQLLEALRDIPIPPEPTSMGMVLALAGRLPAALAVVLTPLSSRTRPRPKTSRSLRTTSPATATWPRPWRRLRIFSNVAPRSKLRGIRGETALVALNLPDLSYHGSVF